jgi:Phytanoyl-CoA dioxygenase (PhyH)
VTTIDRRTRLAGGAAVMDAPALFGDLADRLAATGALAARGVGQLGLAPLGLEVDREAAHLEVDDGDLVAREGAIEDGLLVGMDAAACSELFQDVTSTFGLIMAGRVQVRRGESDQFVAWEPVLRAVFDERPVYEPGSIELRARDGDPLDLRRSFRIDDPGEEIGEFLAEAGYLHLRGVFTEAEMAVVSAELDVAHAEASQDDGASWWARTGDGWYASRVLGFNLKSPTLRELLASDRFRAIGELTDDTMVQRDPDHGDSAEGLWKKVGVVEGISDVSWHKDCSLGGHSRGCCGIVVGLSVTGADERSGELGVIAGSHRANVPAIGVRPDLDLPRVPLPTETGDVTVHCTCTLHMSRPPVDRERRVVYTGFALSPRPGDVHDQLDPEEIRRRRAALNDQVRVVEHRQGFGRDPGAFALDTKS